MNYITTNIRIPEDDYMRLKMEAVSKRISFSEVIRQTISSKQQLIKVNTAKKLIAETEKLRKELQPYFRDFDVVKAIREMRESR